MPSENEKTAVELPAKVADSVGLKTETVEKRAIQLTRTLPGKIEPDIGKEVDVTSRVAGRIDKLCAVPGARVNSGQPLAVLTSREVSDLEAQALTLQAKLETAKAQEEREHQIYIAQVHLPQALTSARVAVRERTVRRDLAESQLNRQHQLYVDKIGAHKDLLAAQAAFDQAQSDLDLARTNLKREESLYKNKSVLRGPYQMAQAERITAEKELQAIKAQLRFLGVDDATFTRNVQEGSASGSLTIKAPLAGVVDFYDVAVGEMVTADKPMFKLRDLSTVLVSADIPESDSHLATVGKKIEVVPPGATEPLSATVYHVATHVNPETRTIAVRARLSNNDQRFKPGMFAEVRLEEHDKSALAVAKNAIQEDANRNKIVFVKKTDGFEPSVVRTGIEGDDFVEIISGLSEGDTVATQGSLMLKTQLNYNKTAAAE